MSQVSLPASFVEVQFGQRTYQYPTLRHPITQPTRGQGPGRFEPPGEAVISFIGRHHMPTPAGKLIISSPTDFHARAVAWALNTIAPTRILDTVRGIDSEGVSFILGDSGPIATLPDLSQFDTIWYRRVFDVTESSSVQADDKQFVLREKTRFQTALIGYLESTTDFRWVDPPAATQLAENKLVQLTVAQRVGMIVPRTLITSEPARVRDFFRREGAMVIKPYDPYRWDHRDQSAQFGLANLADESNIWRLSDVHIACCVTIYQQFIHKVADIRIVVMGDHLFPFRITQIHRDNIDYRAGIAMKDQVQIESTDVPSWLQDRMLAFMRALGVSFASADFLLLEDDNYVFLDLNPSGQWLFLEQCVPESRLLAKFCAFLSTGKPDRETASLFPSLEEYKRSAVNDHR
jgi:glutathione synthase/RimK-type ligase-like ATP-grasp enzyme